MTAPLPAHDHRARFVRDLARGAAFALAVLVCGSARAQGESDAVARLVATDAAGLLSHPDPVVRGEAALVLAAQRDPANHTALVAIARDPDEAARVRGLLALGLQQTPGVAEVLADQLQDLAERTKPAGLAAAFALGSLPPDQAPGLVTSVLTTFPQASWKRQHDVLAALLVGLQHAEQPTQLTPLRRLFDEESNRDPEVRARLLELLLPIDPLMDAARLKKVLERGSEAERRALVGWLAGHPSPADDQLLAPLERIARDAAAPEMRALGLAALTRLRHLPALEMAAKALRSEHPVEAAQGLRSALRIGGAGMRGALERHLAAESRPDLQAALLLAWSAPPSAELADTCERLAVDHSTPTNLRCAAALVLSHRDPARAAPLLRTLFRDCDRGAPLDELASALAKGTGAATPLADLLRGATDLARQPERWRALLAAGHPEAVRAVLQTLREPKAPARELAGVLQMWREATGVLSPGVVQALPEPLRVALTAR